MCITVIRWFACDQDMANLGLPILPPRDIPADPWDEWSHPAAPWQDLMENQLILPNDMGFSGRPMAEGFMLIRHREVHTIRCSYPNNNDCQRAPFIRSEIYTEACTACTGAEPLVRGIQPFLAASSTLDYANLTAEQQNVLSSVADSLCDFEEKFLLILFWLYRGGRILDANEVQICNAILCCTEAPGDVITRGNWTTPRICGCPNMEKPWAHNIARSMRMNEADLLLRTTKRVELAQTYLAPAPNMDLLSHPARSFHPRQAWIAFEDFDGGMIQRAMDKAILEAYESHYARGLACLAPEARGTGPGSLHTPGRAWFRRCENRLWIARQLAFYPSIDPGLNPMVRQLMLDRRFTGMLRGQRLPDPYYANPMAEVVQLGGVQMLTLSELLRWMGILDSVVARKPHYASRLDYKAATSRRHGLLKVLRHNRRVAARNAIMEHKGLKEPLDSAVIPTAEAFAASGSCMICLNKIRVYPGHVDNSLPLSFKTVGVPCCGNAFHEACLIPLMVGKTNLTCPLCRSDLHDHDWPDIPQWIHLADKDMPRGFV